MGNALVAILQIVIGAAGGLVVTVMMIVGFLRRFLGYEPTTLSFILSFLVMVGAVGLCIHGGRALFLQYRYQAITSEIAGRSRVKIADLCQKLQRSLPELSGELYGMVRQGLLPKNGIDLERKELVLDPASSETALTEEERKTVFRTYKKWSKIPLGLVGLLWIIFALAYLVFGQPPIYWPIALSVVVYAVASLAFPNETLLSFTERPEEFLPPIATGNQEMDQFLTSSGQQVKELTGLGQEITNVGVRQAIGELLLIAKEIFTFVQTHPEKIGQLRQFINYYLPMTIKLLTNYRDLEKQSQKGENVVGAMEEIESFMGTVTGAFKKELDNLYEGKAIDISADITVMKNMMNMERI